MSGRKEWYLPGPSIKQFHASQKLVRVILGGRGSGKTTAIAVESAAIHGFNVAGAKVYILRKTEKSNQDTTGETFDRVFAQLGSAYVDTGDSLFKKIEGGRIFRIPSKLAVEKYNEFRKTHNPTKAELVRWLDSEGSRWCSHIVFSGVPTQSSRESRFRGFECSLLILVEADQFDEADVDMAINCLRWRSPDPTVCDERGYVKRMGMILDSNPPGTKHWLALREEVEKKDPNSSWQFWHIHTQENEQNLPPNYVSVLKATYARKPAMYARMVEGKYADAYEGSPVFWAFTQDHVFEDLPWPKGAYLVRGWDFGTSNAVVFSAYGMQDGEEYWWDLNEIVLEQTDTETQVRRVLDLTEKVFPFWNDRNVCSGVFDGSDVAGNQKSATGSSAKILRASSIFPASKKMGLSESITLVNFLLEHRNKQGQLVYRIDRKGCPRLMAASEGGYRYPAVGEPGYGSDEPLKGAACDNLDHVADASRYAKNLVLTMLSKGLVKPQDSILSKSQRVGNRKRRHY